MPDRKKFLTPTEFQEALEATTSRTISLSAIYRSIQKAKLPASQIGGRYLIDRKTFEAQAGIKLRHPEETEPEPANPSPSQQG